MEITMKHGFTLAEVLIAIAIIGVVSAITMPVLINKYQEKVTVSKVKKIYSTINQAILLSIKDNGYPYEWNVDDNRSETSAKQLASYITPYVKILKDCNVQTGCFKYDDVFLLSGNKHDVNYETNRTYYKFILNDGSYIFMRSSIGKYCEYTDIGVSTCGLIGFDINGPKKPNTIGRDIFVTNITNLGQLKSADINDYCINKGAYSGFGCLGYILQNNNMNYLK